MYTMTAQKLLNYVSEGRAVESENLRGLDLSNLDLGAANLRGSDLSQANLTGTNLQEAHLERITLDGAILKETDLRGANLSYVQVSDMDLSTCNLERLTALDSKFIRVILKNQSLKSVNLTGSAFINAPLVGLDVQQAHLTNLRLLFCLIDSCTFQECRLSGSDFGLSRILNTTFKRVDLTKASFMGATFRDIKFLESLLKEIDCTLVDAEGMDITGSQYPGLCSESFKVKGLKK